MGPAGANSHVFLLQGNSHSQIICRVDKAFWDGSYPRPGYHGADRGLDWTRRPESAHGREEPQTCPD
ncbi:hypothetical protein HMPREF1868_00398 [Olsenella sp. DNF00959]|nr:hypothetical protein HMPREF1868_00398 [Olsenella sp. DNF00959]